MQVHRSTKVCPFALTLSRHPPNNIIGWTSMSDDTKTCEAFFSRQTRLNILRKFKSLFKHADSSLTQKQMTYKNYYDRFVREFPQFRDEVYVYKRPQKQQSTTESAANTPKSKLTMLSDGVSRALSSNVDTVVLRIHDNDAQLNVDRWTLRLQPQKVKQPSITDNTDFFNRKNALSSRKVIGNMTTLPSDIHILWRARKNKNVRYPCALSNSLIVKDIPQHALPAHALQTFHSNHHLSRAQTVQQRLCPLKRLTSQRSTYIPQSNEEYIGSEMSYTRIIPPENE